MNILDQKGFLILASNTETTDYILCAEKLAQSLRYWHPDIPICLLTDQIITNSNFDYIKVFPYGDKAAGQAWKLSNDWQAWIASPFKHTIKLEADMILTSSIDHWWKMFMVKDIVISTGIRDFYGNKSLSKFYRKTFVDNNLPDLYNAITYWRQCDLSQRFFRIVQQIFNNWDYYRTLLSFSDDVPTTDLVYAMAAVIVGVENVTLPDRDFISIVHMKKHIINIESNDWTKELVWEFDHDRLRINTVTQTGFFHYHIKSWANKIEQFQ